MVSRPTWDETFLSIAQVVAERATCSRRKVGAVLTQDNRIISTGYNGAPSGAPHCTDGGCPRGKLTYEDVPAGADYNLHPCVAIHAEANALLRAGHAASKGGTLYITTAPCQQCWNLIQAAEVGRIVTLDGTYHDGDKHRSLPDRSPD